MADCAIIRIDVWHMSHGQTEICWQLSPNFHVQNGPIHFYVDIGQAGTDEWIVLNTEPIIEECCYTDVCQRNWEFISNVYYRVRMVLPNEPGAPVHTSFPYPADGNLARRDWLIAREILRKELLQQSKIDGTLGFLLKRKKFGVACTNPACLEWDTREVTDSNCPICYGTGLVGGYYPGIEHYFTFAPGTGRRIDAGKPPRGVSSDISDSVRSILYPKIDTRDVWVNAGSDQRYVVDRYDVIVDMKSVPLVGTVHLRLAPATDVVYSVPVEGTPPLEEPPLSEQPNDARRGLNATYEDW